MINLPIMKLEDQPLAEIQAFVFGTPVSALTSQQLLVPATAELHILDADEWCELHVNLLCSVASFDADAQRVNSHWPSGELSSRGLRPITQA